MLTHSAPNTQINIYIRLKQPHFNDNGLPAFNFGIELFFQRNRIVPIEYYLPPRVFGLSVYSAIMIAPCHHPRCKLLLFKSQLCPVDVLDHLLAPPYHAVTLARKYRFRAHRAILLTHQTWLVHRPWQTPSLIHKRRPYLQWPAFCELALAKFFRERNRPYRRRRTHKPARHTRKLASARAYPVIQYRRPYRLNSALNPRRLYHIGRANPHALPALDAPFQKLTFPASPRRPHLSKPVILSRLTAQP